MDGVGRLDGGYRRRLRCGLRTRGGLALSRYLAWCLSISTIVLLVLLVLRLPQRAERLEPAARAYAGASAT